MLKHAEPVRDPFAFSSSSPDRSIRLPPARKRYTIKTQKALYTSVDSTSPPTILAFPRHSDRSTPSSSELSVIVTEFCSQLEVAQSSPTRPRVITTSRRAVLPNLVTQRVRQGNSWAVESVGTRLGQVDGSMVKSKAQAHSVKPLTVVPSGKLTSELCHDAPQQTERRRKRPTDATRMSRSPARPGAMTMPVAVPRGKTQRSMAAISKGRWPYPIPAIVVRAPSPDPIAWLPNSVQSQQETGLRTRDDATSPSHSACAARVCQSEDNTRLTHSHIVIELDAELSAAKSEIDAILSKYLDHRFSELPHAMSHEMLRYLAALFLKAFVHFKTEVGAGDPDGLGLLIDFIKAVFRHIVTGMFHVLADVRAPYASSKNLALLCLALSSDLASYVRHRAKLSDGSFHDGSRRKKMLNTGHENAGADPFAPHAQQLDYSSVFHVVLDAELQALLDEGSKLSNKHNKLSLPGRSYSLLNLINSARDDLNKPLTPRRRVELEREIARAGQAEDAFVCVDAIRFVGELFNLGCIQIYVLSGWIDRLLVQTVHPDIPSTWEIECACALLITVGETLEDVETLTDDVPSDLRDTINQHASHSTLMNRTMHRIEELIVGAAISEAARDWLVQVKHLRARVWQLHCALNSPDGSGA